jgi:hypothetical protein
MSLVFTIALPRSKTRPHFMQHSQARPENPAPKWSVDIKISTWSRQFTCRLFQDQIRLRFDAIAPPPNLANCWNTPPTGDMLVSTHTADGRH